MSRDALVVVSYGTHAQTVEYVRRFRRTVGNWPAVVVNNGPFEPKRRSTDLSSLRSEGVDVLDAPANLGYGAGNNLAIRHMIATYPAVRHILVSNNDVVIGSDYRDFCRAAGDVLDRSHDLLAVGPRIVAAGTGKAQSPKYEYPPAVATLYNITYPLSFWIEGLRREIDSLGRRPRSVFTVNGSLWMMSLRELSRIGCFDEGTFLYWEEEIVGKKAKDRRLRIIMMPEYRVIHDHGFTVKKALNLRSYYRTFTRSFRRYMHLYKPRMLRILAIRTFRYRVMPAFVGKLVLSRIRELRRA